MVENNVDILIIGAGANGSSVAYEAVKRGLSVALIDSGDIGGGTSCRSSKLLHGGVRYLELAFKTYDLAQLRLVREALRERQHWLKETPFLARRLELALPTMNAFNKFYYGLGLSFYDALSGSTSLGRSRFLSKKALRKSLPYIANDLNGGVVYSDGQFDDARLNLLLALTAQSHGAELRTYTRIIELLKNGNGKLNGAISLSSSGMYEKWKAKIVVNATGISSDKVRKLAEPTCEDRILISRGVHIIINANLCPDGLGVLLPSTDDGRVLFLLPFYGRTQIGTTDIPCDISQATSPSEAEIKYLEQYIHKWFPHLGKISITSCWAGGRPLVKPSRLLEKTSKVVREHIIETLECGLISVMGGKWTTCRPIALDTLKAIEKELSISFPSPKLLTIKGSTANYNQTRKILDKHKTILRKYLPNTSLLDNQINHLQSLYGVEALEIITTAKEIDRQPLSNVIPLCQAEILHSIVHEKARTTTDILLRRCKLALVDIAEAERLVPIVQNTLKEMGLPEQGLDMKM